MASFPNSDPDVRAAVEAAARGMVAVRHWGDVSFVSLPLFGPDNSPVTVRVTRDMTGFRVDDAGATHRELDRFGMGRSFSSTAPRVAARDDLSVIDKVIVGYADENDLERAIADVGLAAWSVADRVYAGVEDAGEEHLEDSLRERLVRVFGASSLDERQKISGSSSTEWEVAAVLRVEDHLAVFQAVSDHANSIYRASAAFHDLAALPIAPSLVAVVKSKEDLGSKLGILSQVARVIEEDQSDDVFRRAVAA